jgi:hypothetical protein
VDHAFEPNQNGIMKRQILLLIFVILGSFPALAQVTTAPPRPMIVGGWRVGQIDDEARVAAAAAVRAIQRPNVRLVAINSVETQVVAGTNYRLRLTLSDKAVGKRWSGVTRTER